MAWLPSFRVVTRWEPYIEKYLASFTQLPKNLNEVFTRGPHAERLGAFTNG